MDERAIVDRRLTHREIVAAIVARSVASVHANVAQLNQLQP